MAKTKILNREQILEGHAFNIQKVLLRLPNGKERNYDLVDHANAVTILPLDEEGMVHFVRQYRVGAEKELLELPAGVIDPGEDPVTTAHRELREEIGMDAENMISLGGFYIAAGYSTEYMHVFLATALSKAPLEQDEDEFLSIEKISFAEAIVMVRNGMIEDGKSISAFHLAFSYFQRIVDSNS
jgi:ADP-ribose pyrophosphatase